MRTEQVRVTQVTTVPLWTWGLGVKGHRANTLQAGTGFSHHPRGGYYKILQVAMETCHPHICGSN